jgi:hypothetical protein
MVESAKERAAADLVVVGVVAAKGEEEVVEVV